MLSKFTSLKHAKIYVVLFLIFFINYIKFSYLNMHVIKFYDAENLCFVKSE